MFQKVYFTTTTYRIWEVENSRFIDELHYVPYLDWITAGHQPEPVSGDRFITIVDGMPVEDPNKAAILAAEAYAAAHPEPAMDETLRYACNMIDSIMLGGNKGASYYNYLRMRWYTRDLTTANMATMVQKRFVTQAEANAIMATEQVPLA